MMLSTLNAPHYAWGEDCAAWHLCASAGLSVIQEKMSPGTTEKMHYHERSQQVFYILAGVAYLELEGVVHILHTQQSLVVLPGQKHCIRNQSAAELHFLVISQPSTHGVEGNPGDRVNLE